MKPLLIAIIIAFVGISAYAQNVGIGTNSPLDYAKLDISSDSTGLMTPRLDDTQISDLGTKISDLGPAGSAEYNGLIVFHTNEKAMFFWDDSNSGFTNGGWSRIIDFNLATVDLDSLNEIQTLSISNDTIFLSSGGFVVVPVDADSDPNNELQNLSSSTSGANRTINISGGSGTTINVADNDNNSSNELQNLSSSSSGTNRTINISEDLELVYQ